MVCGAVEHTWSLRAQEVRCAPMPVANGQGREASAPGVVLRDQQAPKKRAHRHALQLKARGLAEERGGESAHASLSREWAGKSKLLLAPRGGQVMLGRLVTKRSTRRQVSK